MSEQTTQPEPNEVPAGEVQRRDHVILPHREHVFRVDQTHRYTNRDQDGDAVEKVLLVITRIGDTVPQTERRWVNEPIRVATDEQVAEARDAALCAQAVADLRKLAELVETHKPRFKSWSGLTVSGTMIDGEISRVAAALGMELRDGYGASKSKRLAWSPTESDLGEGLSVSFEGLPAPEPVVEAAGDGCPKCGRLHFPWCAPHGATGVEVEAADDAPEADQPWHFTFGSGQLYDGRYVVISGTYASARERMLTVFGQAWCAQYSPADFVAGALIELPESEWPPVVADEDEPAADQEHRVATAWKGGPGECGAQCACGVTYDGFDTIKEPGDLIDRHVAAEMGAPSAAAEQSGR